MRGFFTKEKDIGRAQYLDLVYSQSGTLYEEIPNSPRPLNYPSILALESHMDGMASFVKT